MLPILGLLFFDGQLSREVAQAVRHGQRWRVRAPFERASRTVIGQPRSILHELLVACMQCFRG